MTERDDRTGKKFFKKLKERFTSFIDKHLPDEINKLPPSYLITTCSSCGFMSRSPEKFDINKHTRVDEVIPQELVHALISHFLAYRGESEAYNLSERRNMYFGENHHSDYYLDWSPDEDGNHGLAGNPSILRIRMNDSTEEPEFRYVEQSEIGNDPFN